MFLDSPAEHVWFQNNISSGTTLDFYGGWYPTIAGPRMILPTDRILMLGVNADIVDDLVTYRPSTREWGVYLNNGSPFQYRAWKPLTIGGSATPFDEDVVIFGTMP